MRRAANHHVAVSSRRPCGLLSGLESQGWIGSMYESFCVARRCTRIASGISPSGIDLWRLKPGLDQVLRRAAFHQTPNSEGKQADTYQRKRRKDSQLRHDTLPAQ